MIFVVVGHTDDFRLLASYAWENFPIFSIAYGKMFVSNTLTIHKFGQLFGKALSVLCFFFLFRFLCHWNCIRIGIFHCLRFVFGIVDLFLFLSVSLCVCVYVGFTGNSVRFYGCYCAFFIWQPFKPNEKLFKVLYVKHTIELIFRCFSIDTLKFIQFESKKKKNQIKQTGESNIKKTNRRSTWPREKPHLQIRINRLSTWDNPIFWYFLWMYVYRKPVENTTNKWKSFLVGSAKFFFSLSSLHYNIGGL